MIEEKGSFRDPAGKIFYSDEKVFRKVNKDGIDRLKFILENNIISKSIEKEFLIKTTKYKSTEEECIFEHEKIPDTMAFNHKYHQGYIEIHNAIQTVAIATPKNIDII